MVRDKYSFKMEWAEIIQMRSEVDAVLSNAHYLHLDKKTDLVPLSVLRELSVKFSRTLAITKSEYRFTLKQHELLAFHFAYMKGWIKQTTPTMHLVTTIDRQI